MAISIAAGLTDDNDFVRRLNSILNAKLKQENPEQLWVIQIDNWFDHKWLRFSGNGAIAFRPSSDGPTALGFPWNLPVIVKKNFHDQRLTFPPFTPDRVLCQWSFERHGSEYIEAAIPGLPRQLIRRRSGLNLQNKISQRGVSSVFAWFSGNTLKNERGSLMVYTFKASQTPAWFASFSKSVDWAVQKTRGIDREDVRCLLSSA